MIDPSTSSQLYDAMATRWALPKALMGGTLAMRAAGTRYLPRHPAENSGIYTERASRSVLRNHFRRTVTKLVGRIFAEPLIISEDMPGELMQSSWSSDVLKAGASQPSFTFERAFSDISQYQLLTGCVLDRLRLSVRPDRLITGTFGVIGKSSAMNSSPLDASPTAAAANDPMDSFSGSLDEGGSSIGIVVGLELNIDNNLEPGFVIGGDEASSLLAGQSRITGEITTYFEDASLLNKFAARTESSLILTCSGTGGSLEFNLPRIVYTGAENPALGAGPITLSLPFTALYDESESTNLTITRTAA